MLKIPKIIPLSFINSERKRGKTPNELLSAKSLGVYSIFSVEILQRKANSIRILWKSRWPIKSLSNSAEMTRNGQKWSKNVKYAHLPGAIGNSSCGPYDHICKTDAINRQNFQMWPQIVEKCQKSPKISLPSSISFRVRLALPLVALMTTFVKPMPWSKSL